MVSFKSTYLQTSPKIHQTRLSRDRIMRLPHQTSAGGGASYFSVGVPITSPVTSPRESQRESDYFYTLVFPNTKALDDDQSPRGSGEVAGNNGRIRYSDALATLRAVTAGGKEREAEAMEEFCVAWIAKFRTPPPAPHDTIPLLYFQELVRELIVQRFDNIPGLFMKTSVSQDERSLLISFRPSKALLCATADRLQMKVAVMSEIDPGENYWASYWAEYHAKCKKIMGEYEAAVDAGKTPKKPKLPISETEHYSRAEAQEELYRFFLAGKISSEEAQLFDHDGDREDAGMWSRRVHALRRFFDPKVAEIVAKQECGTPSSLPTTHLPFKDRASLRYLYRQIDGAGEEPTPFRTVDKIRLTKTIIDDQFDCDTLAAKRLLTHHFCTHTHHTDGVDTSIDVLRVQWGALSSPLRLYRQGITRLSHVFHFQPVTHVRNYFGEELALYFAYTSFYAHVLQLLCVVAVAAALLHSWGSFDGVPSYWYYVAFAVLNTAFVPSFVRKWEIRERVLAMEWGVTAVKDDSATRPQFRGELARSFITHRLETYYSPRRRQIQQLASGALLLCLSAGLLTWDFVLLTSSTYRDLASSSQLLMVHVCVALFAKSLGVPLAALCKALTDWENYTTQREYDTNLTLKFATIQSVNLFGVLWLQTFVLPLVPQPHPPLDCHQQAAHLLTTILSVDLVISMLDVCLPVAKSLLSTLPSLPLSSQGRSTADRSRLLVSSPPSAATLAMDAELDLDPYEGVMFDYAQVVITFGFVSWFAALAPLATLLAWGVAVLQIRVDAYKLCQLTQRPFPSQKNSIGSWASYLRFLAFGAWIHNGMLTVLYVAPLVGPSGMQDLSDFVLLRSMPEGADAEERWLAMETLVLVVFAGFAFIAFIAGVHDQSDRAQLKRLHWLSVRHHFLENKYINNLDRVPDSVRDALPSGRVFLNGVHLYVVTGNKAEEDAAEEILEELAQLQARSAHLQSQIRDLRANGAAVGQLVVEIGGINILPVMDAMTKSVDPLVQLQLMATSDDHSAQDKKAAGKRGGPVSTAELKKNRSPQWNQPFELSLQSLEDALVVSVFDWELLGKNRRIGNATLHVADIVTTAPPTMVATATATSVAQPAAVETKAKDTAHASASDQQSASPSTKDVRMASFELLLEIPGVLLSTMHADLVKHGHPKLSLRCGVRLDPLGWLLYQQRQLQTKIRTLKHREKQFFQWK